MGCNFPAINYLLHKATKIEKGETSLIHIVQNVDIENSNACTHTSL